MRRLRWSAGCFTPKQFRFMNPESVFVCVTFWMCRTTRNINSCRRVSRNQSSLKSGFSALFSCSPGTLSAAFGVLKSGIQIQSINGEAHLTFLLGGGTLRLMLYFPRSCYIISPTSRLSTHLNVLRASTNHCLQLVEDLINIALAYSWCFTLSSGSHIIQCRAAIAVVVSRNTDVT